MTVRVVSAIRHLLRVGPPPDLPAPDDTPFIHEMHHEAQQSIRRRRTQRQRRETPRLPNLFEDDLLARMHRREGSDA